VHCAGPAAWEKRGMGEMKGMGSKSLKVGLVEIGLE
jgi:hypothetical protein